MRTIIVTGRSIEGTTTALKILEDAGYYCVDQLPVPLLMKFLELAGNGKETRSVALGVNLPTKEDAKSLVSVLDTMQELSYEYELLYIEDLKADNKAEDDYADVKAHAKLCMDVSRKQPKELRAFLVEHYVEGEELHSLEIKLLSFGFRYGIPEAADLVFDVRFLPNPHQVEELRPLTGLDKEVRDYVMEDERAKEFISKLSDLMQFLIPNYIKEGKKQMVIGIGCNGGRHRSVALAEALSLRLGFGDFGIHIEHRDIDKRKTN